MQISLTSVRSLVADICDDAFTVASMRCVFCFFIYSIVIIVNFFSQYLCFSSQSVIDGKRSLTMILSLSVSLFKFLLIELQ
jgi:hypothetical protein